MPFFAKMSAHFRGSGYSAKEPQSKSIYTYSDKYYSSKYGHRQYANKDKIADYDDNNYRNHNYEDFVCKSSNDERSRQIRKDNDNYVNWHYRRNKEKFASWDIRDFHNQRNSIEKGILNYDLSTRNPSEIVDVEVEDIFVNGDSLSSPTRKRNGILHEKQRSSSLTRHCECRSDSFDRQSSKFREKKIVEPWSEEDDNEPLYTTFKGGMKPIKNNSNRDQLLRQIENFGTLKKRNDKNTGLNLGFRAIVDRFRTKSDDKEKNEIIQRNKKQEYVDENWQYNSDAGDYKVRKSPKVFEIYPPKDSMAGKNHRSKSHELEPELNSRKPIDKVENYYNSKGKQHENNISKRKSYAFEAPSENFDVQVKKYERVRQDEPDAHRRNSFQDRAPKNSEISQKILSSNGNGTSNARNSRLRDKYKDPLKRESTKNGVLKSKISERHSRPLTPPADQQTAILENLQDEISKERSKDPSRKSFSMKEWYESNRQFAAKYLKEHSKIRELSTSDVSAKDEFIFGSPRECRTFFQIENNDRENHYIDRESREIDSNVEGYREFTTIGQNETPKIIKVRTNTEEDQMKRRSRKRAEKVTNGRRRRYRCESVEVENEEEAEENEEKKDEEEEEAEEEEKDRKETISQRSEICGRSFAMPTRKFWNYRDGGVHITDLEEGQPCLQCGETCSGFLPHIWRKNCTSCKCPREAHDVCHDEWVSVRARLGLKADESRDPAGFDPRDVGLAWAPPGLPPHKVEEYFSMLPVLSVPRLGTAGERHRDRQLATQLPKQDLARAYCRHLDPQHSVSADDFMAARNEIALDIGSVQEVFDKAADCGACNEPLKYGSLAVSASKLGLLYHPTCFRCSQCEELLVDLAYCMHDDALYCERHYAEQLKPRCAACDELIFSGEYTKAMNKDWHSGHFCCWQCDESLTGQRYVLRDEHPYCIKCYESVFANGCEECHKIIGIDSKDLSYKDKHWHEACFLCNKCRVSLVDKQFGSKVDKIYCGNCYDAQFASRCDGCGEIFRAGTKKMEYKTRQWHEKCFCCVVCKNPIGTKSFIPREQEIYCAGCYEDKFATRCVKCNKIITSGGVTYKNEPWHRDCFTCSHCNQSLAGQRFTSRDEKPYCAECFGELFAKRCTACSKPITGIGGTRFISFEDRHWHNDCFICAGCKTSLVGRGFITDGEDIICPECAKQKLS